MQKSYIVKARKVKGGNNMAKQVNQLDKSYFYWRGALAVVVGVMVLVWPKVTLLSIVTLISIWLLLSGVINIIEGFASVKEGGGIWIVNILVGLFSLGVGAYLVQRPALTTLAVVTLLGLVFIVQGLAYLINAFVNPSANSGRRMLSLVYAAISIIAGFWLWRYPLSSSLAFVWLLGLYAIASGAMLIAIGANED